MSRPYIDLSACDTHESTRDAYRDADQYDDGRPSAVDERDER